MIGIYDSDYWFSVKQNMDNFIVNLRKLEYFCKNKGLTIEVNYGVDAIKKFVIANKGKYNVFCALEVLRNETKT